MRILLISEFYPQSASDWKGVFIRDYVHALRRFSEVEVLCTRPRGDKPVLNTQRDQDSQVTFHVTADRSSSGLSKWLVIRKWYKEALQQARNLQRPDAIYVHNSVFQGRLAKRLAAEWSIPYYVTEHTGPFSSISDNELKRRQAKRVMEDAERVFTVSERTKKEIEQAGIHPNQIKVTHNPVDTETFKRGLDGPHDALLFVSRMDEFKGAMRTLKAFEILLKKRPTLTLKMIGDGEEYLGVQRYVRENNLGASVSMYGAMSKSEIYGVMKRCDLLLFPSRHESFGLVAAEAWASGIPVVMGTDIGSSELMKSTSTNLGELVDVEQPEDIARGADKILSALSAYNRNDIRKVIVDSLSINVFGDAMKAEIKQLSAQT